MVLAQSISDVGAVALQEQVADPSWQPTNTR